MKSTPIIIDANSLIMRRIMLAATDDLNAGGVFTGGIYGSVDSMRKILERPQLNPGLIVACFDNGIPEKRMELLPDYKRTRKERKDLIPGEFYDAAMSQLNICYDFFKSLGVVSVSFRHREADDVVGAVVRRLLRQGFKPVVVTSDKDLWQMVGWGDVKLWDLSKRIMLDRNNFDAVSKKHERIEHTVPLSGWLMYRTLVGDSSDGIKGSEGCGPKRASDLINRICEYGGLQGDVTVSDVVIYLRGVSVKLKKFEVAIIAAKEYLSNVYEAINLMESFGNDATLDKVIARRPSFDREAFKATCVKYRMNSLLLPGAVRVFDRAIKNRDS